MRETITDCSFPILHFLQVAGVPIYLTLARSSYGRARSPDAPYRASPSRRLWQISDWRFDGETRLFDGHVLDGEVFASLKSAEAFADWKLDYETLTWNGGDIDISADYVLNHSKPC